ncbi:hypothetical protein PBY51_013843 [Eleginops maclovinus]|uniref:Secreted protein n=1 Tax=Eleginops maclovinus TaxID=56733 RepID=A0AAN7YCS0_ELEMC|nr:hypothetical protein PBY51_013843 [Eleginops maclovinus]
MKLREEDFCHCLLSTLSFLSLFLRSSTANQAAVTHLIAPYQIKSSASSSLRPPEHQAAFSFLQCSVGASL